VEGRLWGVLTVHDLRRTLPPATEERVGKFTELVATAIANAESRGELAASEARARELAEEQAALRRVATVVARAAASEEVFSTVAREVASVLNVPGVIVQRYEADGTVLTLGEAFDSDLAGAERFFGVGTRMPRDPGSLAAQVFETHRAVRIDDFSTLQGTIGDLARAAGPGSGCAGPIVVDGELWGKMCVSSRTGTVLPVGTENRLHDFIELVATAIANYEARGDLAASEARARELAEEQSALRRVATLVARAPASEHFFSAVAREVASVLNVPGVLVARFEADGAVDTVGAAYDSDLSRAGAFLGVGTRMPPDPGSLAEQVFCTHLAARVDDYSTLPGSIGDAARAAGLGSGCAGPIVVNGDLWGQLAVFSRAGTVLPVGMENRLHDFIELVATAIANYEGRADLAASEARARELASEQAALRRVATLVAQGASPDELFSAVAREVAGIIDIPAVGIHRYEADGTFTILGIVGDTGSFTIGSRWPVEDDGIAGMIRATGRPSRKDNYAGMPGPIGDAKRDDWMLSTVGVPIVVEGSIWGCLVAGAMFGRPIPAGTEERLARFTELVATAVSNATTRTELLTSRARLVSAADETRRRLERDLHDGIQQWLVALALRARRAAVFSATGESQCRSFLVLRTISWQ
jgi:GAF domain-containing protein